MSGDRSSAAADEELFDGFDDDEEAETQGQGQDGHVEDGHAEDAGLSVEPDGQRDAGQADDGSGQREGRPQETPDGDDGQRVNRPNPRARARAELREARERAEAADRRAAAVEQQLQQLLGRQSQEQRAAEEQAFQQQLQMLPPEQQTQAIYQRVQQQSQHSIGTLREQLREDNDRAQFQQLLNSDKRYRHFADQVEDFRRQTTSFVPRQILLWTAIGKAAFERAESARNRASTRAAAAREVVTTRPAASGQGQPAERRRSSTPYDRLVGLPL